jgi:hypothetical protein
MSAARSVQIYISNNMDFELTYLDSNLCHGQWTDGGWNPKAIPAKTMGGFEAKSAGFMTGTERWVKYQRHSENYSCKIHTQLGFGELLKGTWPYRASLREDLREFRFRRRPDRAQEWRKTSHFGRMPWPCPVPIRHLLENTRVTHWFSCRVWGADQQPSSAKIGQKHLWQTLALAPTVLALHSGVERSTMTSKFSRRFLPVCFTFAAVAVSLSAQSNNQQGQDDTASLVGSWLFSLTSPQVSFLALGTFTSDGTFVGTAQGDGTFGPLNATEGPAHGVWATTGHNAFRATFNTIWYTPSAVLFGIFSVHFSGLAIDPKSGQLNGMWTATLRDPNNNTITPPFGGTLTAKRIQISDQ